MNFLEQLVAEWYEFRGYFVRRNVKVGPRNAGGHEGELDVIAFHPEKRHLVHIEPSMDSLNWSERERRFARKFETGRKYIPGLFAGLEVPSDIEQIALLVYGSRNGRATIGGARLLMIGTLMREIKSELGKRRVDKAAIPEQYFLLRALQFAAQYWEVSSEKLGQQTLRNRGD